MFKKDVFKEVSISTINYAITVRSSDEDDTLEKMSKKIIILLKKIKDVDK